MLFSLLGDVLKQENTMNQTTRSTQGLGSIALAFLIAAAPAHSQDATATDEAFQLDDFVTVANRIELPLDRIGSSVELITQYDLEVTNQSFLLEALRTTPGFNVRNNGGPGNAFGITTRGLNSNRPVVLIDGIEVSNPADGRIVNFGNLFGSNASRVEILKGPQSSLYGADAVAGVINIQTQATGSEGGFLDTSIGSFDTYEGHLGYQGAGGAFNYAVNLSHFQTHGFSSQDPALGASNPALTENAWADDDAYENTTLSTKIDFRANEHTTLYFVGYYNESYAEFDPGNPANVFGTPFADNYTDNEQAFAKIGGKTNVSEHWQSRFDIGFTDVESQTNSSFPSSSQGQRWQLDWQNTVSINENWQLVAGAEYEIEEDSFSGLERDDKSLYAENVFAIGEQLDWSLGLRYDDNEDYGSETTYRTTASYRIEHLDARLHASYGTSFQAPTFFQLANPAFGNPNVNPESGNGWDFGIEKTFANQNLAVSSTLFGYDISDKINFDFNAGTFGSYANDERYQSKGIETAANWHPSDSLRLKFAHTYTEAEYNDSSEPERVPRNTYSLNGNWNGLDERLNLNATALHTGSQYSLRSSTTKQSSYTVVNLAARYKLSETYTLWARVDNLFDEQYEEIATYQTPGLAYYTGLRLDF